VPRYAVAAGDDPRTPPLRPEQLADLHGEISILGDPTELSVRGFDAIADALRPGIDGVTLYDRRGHSAFFLPVVWKSLPDPRAFLTALAHKAGIDLRRERDHLRAEITPAFSFSSSTPQGPT
jgi:AMMECR1 domain-containing protein